MKQSVMILNSKIVLLCFLLISSVEVSSQTQWRRAINSQTFSVAVNPKNASTIYVGGGGRAFFRSYDGGNTWDSLVVEFESGSAIFTNILVHPIDTSIVLVCGTGFGSVKRSTNGGTTWATVLEKEFDPLIFNGESIFVDRSNAENIYLVTFRPSPPTIYKSTDRGATWDSLYAFIGLEGVCTIVQRPDSASVFYAGAVNGEIYKSSDFGKSWTKKAKLTSWDYSEIPRIAISPRDPLIAYASLFFPFPVFRPGNGGIHKSTDGGETWKLWQCADTSMWSVDVRRFGNQDQVIAGGFTPSGAENFEGQELKSIIEGDSIVVEFAGEQASHLGLSLPWFYRPLYTNAKVWMVKYDTVATGRTFIASEAGFFIRENPTSVASVSLGLPLCSVRNRVVTIDQKSLQELFAGEDVGEVSIEISTLLGTIIHSCQLETSTDQLKLEAGGFYVVSFRSSRKVISQTLLVF